MKIACLFPGQGTQYPGMGKDFFEGFSQAKERFQEADEILGRHLTSIIFNGPQSLLTETKNSQPGIFIVSIAIWSLINDLFPHLKPDYTAGLSLGEYAALTAGGYMDFSTAVKLVERRGIYMNEACKVSSGKMAVVLGLSQEQIEKILALVALPDDLFVANWNCPGQTVLSGTAKGIEAATEIAKERGAKKVLSLPVHGAFHSGLMEPARERLAPYIQEIFFKEPHAKIAMNVSGQLVSDASVIKQQLIDQVTSPVKWEHSVRSLDAESVDLYIELGPGKTLAGFNKRIAVRGKTVSVECVSDLKKLEEALKELEKR